MGNLISRSQEEKIVYGDDSADCQPPEQSQEEEELLNLSALSEELIHTVIERMDYKEYSQLEETSKSMARILNSRGFSLPHFTNTVFVNKKAIGMTCYRKWYDKVYNIRRIPWHVATGSGARIQADYVEISSRISSSRMKAVVKLFEKNKTTATDLRIMEHVTFEPEDLNRLIKVLGTEELDCRQFLARKFFVNPEDGLNKMKNVCFSTSGCTDEEFLKLDIEGLRMINDFITDRGLNKFLKQWKKREREINWFSIEFGATFGVRNFDRILEGLDANPIWTPDIHEQSLIGAIKLEEFELMENGDPIHLYSIWRADSPGDILLLRLSQGRLDIADTNNEPEELFHHLTIDQFYLITNTCKYCDLEFCKHRGRYSSQRLKRSFPRIYDRAIGGIKIARRVFFVAHCAQQLLGIAPARSPLSKDDVNRIHHQEDAGSSLFKTTIFVLRVYLLSR